MKHPNEMTDRELDEAVATEVMGWKKSGEYWIDEQRVIHWPAALIRDAWLVVEKMRTHDTVICASGRVGDDSWYVRFGEAGSSICGVAPTAPRAICIAALLAVMEGR